MRQQIGRGARQGGMQLQQADITTIIDSAAAAGQISLFTAKSGEFVATASAKVHYEDEFDPTTAELYVLGRALDKLSRQLIKEADGRVKMAEHAAKQSQTRSDKAKPVILKLDKPKKLKRREKKLAHKTRSTS